MTELVRRTMCTRLEMIVVCRLGFARSTDISLHTRFVVQKCLDVR